MLFENLEGNDFKVTSVSDINQLRCLAHLLESMVSYSVLYNLFNVITNFINHFILYIGMVCKKIK